MDIPDSFSVEIVKGSDEFVWNAISVKKSEKVGIKGKYIPDILKRGFTKSTPQPSTRQHNVYLVVLNIQI